MAFRKQKDHWKELLPYEKRFEVAEWAFFAVSAVFLTLDFLGAFGVLTIGFDAFIISGVLLVAATVCRAVVYWRTNRTLACSSVVVAFIFGVCVLRDIMRLFR